MSTAAASLHPARERAGWTRWLAAAAVIGLLHAAGLYEVLHWRDESGPAGNPETAVMIELAPVSVASAAPPEPPAPEAPTPDVTPPPPIPKPPQPPSEATPEPPTAAAERAAPAPAVEQPPPPVEVPKLPEARKPAAVLAPPPKPAVKSEPRTKPAPKRVEARPRAAPRAAAGPPPGATASPEAAAAWKSQLLARLAAAKRYPDAARARGEGGVATLTFSIDRSGRVISARLAGSSGSAILDQETVAMAHRASPLPAPPPGVGGGTMSFTVPIRYSVR